MAMLRGAKLLIVFNVIAMLLTVAISGATALSYFAPVVNPESSWIIAFLGLGAQLLIMANFVVFAFWAARMKWIAVLPAVVMLFGIGYWGNYYQFRFSKTYEHQDGNDIISLATYNVKSFSNHYNDSSSFERIARIMQLENPDLICFQEFGYTISHEDSVNIEKYYANYEHKAIHSDMAVFSKYPLNGLKMVYFPNSTNNAMRLEVAVNEKNLVLYNLHLQTTELNQLGGVKAIVEHEDTPQAAKEVGAVLEKNFIQRAFQADSIKKMVDDEKFPTIIAGDLNDTPMSYTYNSVMGDKMVDSFREHGKGYGYTYRNLLRLFRIDYVMCQEDTLEVVDYHSPDIKVSDHNPIFVKLKFKIIEE